MAASNGALLTIKRVFCERGHRLAGSLPAAMKVLHPGTTEPKCFVFGKGAAATCLWGAGTTTECVCVGGGGGGYVVGTIPAQTSVQVWEGGLIQDRRW